jgi:hypothetical protein
VTRGFAISPAASSTARKPKRPLFFFSKIAPAAALPHDGDTMRIIWLLSALVLLPRGPSAKADGVTPPIATGVTRPWPGPDFWAGPQEDWQVRAGKLENTFSGGERKVVILTAELTDRAAPFTFRARVDQQSSRLKGRGYAGLEIGIRGSNDDYREAAVFGHGFVAGVDETGRLFIGAPAKNASRLALPLRQVTLELRAEPNAGNFRLRLRAFDAATKRELGAVVREKVHPSWLTGLVAVTASAKPAKAVDLSRPRPARASGPGQQRGGEFRFAFDRIALEGGKVARHPERAFGPIWWTSYTLTNQGELTLLVQAAPFARNEHLTAILSLDGGRFVTAPLEPVSRTARFRVNRVDPGRTHEFAVRLAGGLWRGLIRRAPTTKRPLVIASFTGNNAAGFPHSTLYKNVRAQKPDLLVFTGDQIYEGVGGYGTLVDQKPNDRTVLCYLRKYALYGWVWRPMLAMTPSIAIPDDHDVFHGNIWGAGGRLADVSRGYGMVAQDSGGYKMSVEFVNAVHRTQTGNLPPPVDPAPCPSGISVYFTRLEYGPFDLAIVADRQFKSAPKPLLPEAKIRNGWPQNPDFDPRTQADLPQAQLLGPRQEKFLARWADERKPDEPFRIVISQSPWLAPQTLPKDMNGDAGVPGLKVYADGEYPPDDVPKPDFDTNGWPPSKRTRALRALRRAGAFHLNGDQHLGTCGRYGLDGYDDGPWWISSPSISNVWPRRWMPSIAGRHRRPGDPKWLGEFDDAFGNHFTLHAVANPRQSPRHPSRLFERAPGYTITRWDAAAGTVSLENWPYWAGPQRPAPDNRPYPGWPVVVDLKTLQRRP